MVVLILIVITSIYNRLERHDSAVTSWLLVTVVAEAERYHCYSGTRHSSCDV